MNTTDWILVIGGVAVAGYLAWKAGLFDSLINRGVGNLFQEGSLAGHPMTPAQQQAFRQIALYKGYGDDYYY